MIFIRLWWLPSAIDQRQDYRCPFAYHSQVAYGGHEKGAESGVRNQGSAKHRPQTPDSSSRTNRPGRPEHENRAAYDQLLGILGTGGAFT